MTALFSPEGRYVPVTVIELGPCVVTQIKTKVTDGYNALQLGFGQKKEKRVNKPLAGHYRKSGKQLFEVLREFSVDKPEEYEVGQTITADMFQIGEKIEVTGTTKGRGFSGVMKRHGFHGGRMSHGSHSKRIPGSIGCSAWPSKVIRGKKMPGQYGVATHTVKNLEIMDVRPEENMILVKGPLPGWNSGLLKVNKRKYEK